jgi:hypothetical protein
MTKNEALSEKMDNDISDFDISLGIGVKPT